MNYSLRRLKFNFHRAARGAVAGAVLAALWFSPALATAQEATPETWPQWRGPTRDGVWAGKAWPEHLGENDLQLVWRVEMGPGYSGPIVTQDRVFTTETVEQKSERVRALDRQDGHEVWSAEWEGAMRVPFFAASNGSWIRATPAFDGRSLFVAGIRDVLVSLDGESGRENWRLDFVQQYGTDLPAFGFVSSPLVDGDFIYVQASGAVCKLEKATGKVVWRVLESRDTMHASAFSSPVLADVARKRVLVAQTRRALVALDPESGETIWSRDIQAFQGMNILTPTVVGDRVFTSAYGGKSHLFEIQGEKERPEVAEMWSNPVEAYMSSPIVIDGHAYLHLRNQRFTCIDLASGQSKWTTKPYGKYWSMVARGDRILALDEEGMLYLVQANPNAFTLLDSRKVSEEETWAHLAVCQDQLFIRELNAMAVWHWQPR